MHNTGISLALATPADVTTLRELAVKTFKDAFGAANSSADMEAYVERSFSIDVLTKELNDPASVFYIAAVNGQPAGYLKLNAAAAQTDLHDEAGLEIERIYVLQDYHGARVGQALFEQALAVAAERAADYIWLGVWEHNPRAIRFYEKNGFVPFGTHLFRLGDDEQTDILMKRVLR